MPLIGEYEPSTWPDARDQVALFEKSHGSEGNTLFGLPVVIITTTGNSTGKLRKTPLMRVEHRGRYAAGASMGGAPTHPSWYHNVKASPLVELQDGGLRQDYTARELDGQERETWWARAVDAYPDYADYQAATSRIIPARAAIARRTDLACTSPWCTYHSWPSLTESLARIRPHLAAVRAHDSVRPHPRTGRITMP
jgi:deazaflavin-dependent oxidoreductase (nitroreductase family)